MKNTNHNNSTKPRSSKAGKRSNDTLKHSGLENGGRSLNERYSPTFKPKPDGRK